MIDQRMRQYQDASTHPPQPIVQVQYAPPAYAEPQEQIFPEDDPGNNAPCTFA